MSSSAPTAVASPENLEDGGTNKPSQRSLRGLDGLNFLMADVRDGLGPYLSVFLKGSQHWSAGDIGVAMAASSVAAALFQIPAGLLVDTLRAKRLLVGVSGLGVAAGCLLALSRDRLWLLATTAIAVLVTLLLFFGLSAAAVTEIFKSAQDAVGSVEGASPTERIVFRVNEIKVPPLDAEAADVKRIDEALRSRATEDLIAQYLAKVQSEVGVTVNTNALNQVSGGTQN